MFNRIQVSQVLELSFRSRFIKYYEEFPQSLLYSHQASVFFNLQVGSSCIYSKVMHSKSILTHNKIR